MRSDAIKQGFDRAPARSMLRATGLGDEDFKKPFIGVTNTWSEITPCNMHLRETAEEIKKSIRAAGGVPFEFNSIVVSDGISIIFVEVKTRSSDFAGDPTEAVDEAKQRHICQTARLFAVKNGLENTSMRFDVISILWPDLEKSPEISHYKSAFEAIGDFQMF